MATRLFDTTTHIYKVSLTRYQAFRPMMDWLKEAVGTYTLETEHKEAVYGFEDEQLAMLFKLRFG